MHFTNANLRSGKKDNKKIKFACYRWADHTDEKKKKRRTLVSRTKWNVCVVLFSFLMLFDFFSFSCHFSSYFAKIVPRQFWIGQRGKLLKKALAMISIINLIIIIIVNIIIIIVDVIFIFVFVIDIVIVLVIVIIIIIIIIILLQLLFITAFSLIIIIILFCSREKKTSLKPPWKFQFYS